MAQARGWLVLVYRVPREPARLRASVWRRLRRLGAVYLQNAIAVLPASSDAQRALQVLRKDISEVGGTAQLFSASALAGEHDVVATYNAARDEEYGEFVDRCDDLLHELSAETAKRHFSFAELEENDDDLTKLRSWFAKIVARDVLAASRRAEAEQILAEATAALERFAEHVYASETGVAEDPDEEQL